MAYLDVDLWPTFAVVLAAAGAIVSMRMLERLADRSAALRTRAALHRALDGPTQE